MQHEEMSSKDELPKALFPSVGRFYQAVVAHGFSPMSLNRDQADTVVRILARTNWKNDNMDIYGLWNTGGDPWGQLIKDVKSYAKVVAKSKKVSSKKKGGE